MRAASAPAVEGGGPACRRMSNFGVNIRDLLRTALRILAGTAVYLGIIVLAAALPPAAGLMLTFPALNGLAFFFSGDARAASIAKTMLWMPVLNGFLCAAYIMLFLLVGRSSPTLSGWCLFVGVVILWLAWVLGGQVRQGIEQRHGLTYSIIVTVAGAALVAAAAFWSASSETTLETRSLTPGWTDAGWITEEAWRSRWKITLFALTLAVLIFSASFLSISDSTRGILSGLPIVPFGGLVSVAGDFGMGVDERFQIFRGMISSVWLGPAVAVWFIYGLSSFYSAREASTVKWRNVSARFSALVAGWAMCFLAIIAISYAIDTLR